MRRPSPQRRTALHALSRAMFRWWTKDGLSKQCSNAFLFRRLFTGFTGKQQKADSGLALALAKRRLNTRKKNRPRRLVSSSSSPHQFSSSPPLSDRTVSVYWCVCVCACIRVCDSKDPSPTSPVFRRLCVCVCERGERKREIVLEHRKCALLATCVCGAAHPWLGHIGPFVL